jgi:acetoin utilization deacetylase AcuC-like enzyme
MRLARYDRDRTRSRWRRPTRGGRGRATLLYTDPRFVEHDTSPGHPERPERMHAVSQGVEASVARDDLVHLTPREATVDELALVHDRAYLDALERFCSSGGGHLDPDTVAMAGSWDIARLAAGAGLDAVERLRGGEADGAFLAVRPPGHHATPSRAMGFCLLNNVAVAAAALAEAGERVLVVDIDAHHGNGTQDAFWDDPRVTYISLHEHPMYPGTGMVRETGGVNAPGTTINVPVPASTAGDVYRRAIDEVIVPVAERMAPTWLLLSTGFDAHRDDPLTDLGLTSGDYYDLTSRLLALVPAGRRLVFLEGGYDLGAITTSTTATLAALAGVEHRPEPVTSGPADALGHQAVGAARRIHQLA